MVILGKASVCCRQHPSPFFWVQSVTTSSVVSPGAGLDSRRSFRGLSLKLVSKLSIGRSVRGINCQIQEPFEDGSTSTASELIEDRKNESRGLLEIAGIVGGATAFSKVLGMARETALAAVFGVGPVVTAFNYSFIVPSIFMSLLGGVNGPIHLAVTASLSKRSQQEGRLLIEKVSAILLLACSAVSICIYVFAGNIIDTIAPGLLVPQFSNGRLCRDIAIVQLKIMSPCALLSAGIGVAFGILSSCGVYGITSIVPALSSVTILGALAAHTVLCGPMATASHNLIPGGIFIAAGAIFGASLQWLLMAKEQHKAGYGSGRIWFGNPFGDKDVGEVLAVLLPAAFGSGMLQIATFTDLYFASFIPGAAAALGYANLLAMAPVGILSSSVLLPLLPIFSRLSQPSEWPELEKKVQQGLLLSTALTLLLTAVVVPLAQPVVRLVFQRYSFDASASIQVSSLLALYVSGSTFYLARDLLVRVFYALGEGRIPFYISVAAICVNAALDWVLVRFAGLGASGLVIATVTVNLASAIALLLILSQRLGGLSPRDWMRPVMYPAFAGAVAAVVTKFTYHHSTWVLSNVMTPLLSSTSSSKVAWAVDVMSVITASSVGMLSFLVPLGLARLPDVDSVLQLLHTRFTSARGT